MVRISTTLKINENLDLMVFLVVYSIILNRKTYFNIIKRKHDNNKPTKNYVDSGIMGNSYNTH